MITIDADAMLVGIMNPVYSQTCAYTALRTYIHKGEKEESREGRLELLESRMMGLPSTSISKCVVNAMSV